MAVRWRRGWRRLWPVLRLPRRLLLLGRCRPLIDMITRLLPDSTHRRCHRLLAGTTGSCMLVWHLPPLHRHLANLITRWPLPHAATFLPSASAHTDASVGDAKQEKVKAHGPSCGVGSDRGNPTDVSGVALSMRLATILGFERAASVNRSRQLRDTNSSKRQRVSARARGVERRRPHHTKHGDDDSDGTTAAADLFFPSPAARLRWSLSLLSRFFFVTAGEDFWFCFVSF